jgi:hypothetical protein
MQVILGSGASAVDVTSAIQESTYSIDSVEKYTSWNDASFVEHRYAIYKKIEGSFEMVFIPDYSIAYSDFLTALESVTQDGITTLSLTVNNLDEELKTINCFVEIQFMPILKISDNLKYKRCTINIKEC